MLTIVKSQPTGLDSYDLATLPKGAWINLLAPSQTELAQVAEATQISVDILRAALDEEERSRTELDDNCLLTVINIPVRQGEYYDTLPLGIILSEDYIVTVFLTDNEVLQGFTNRTWRFFNTSKRTRFMFQMMYRTATLFLKNLQHITRMTDALERNLRQSMQNDDLFEMLEMQKSMTYFTYSLRSNGVVLDKVMRLRSNTHLQNLIKMYEEDEDLLEDVIIENRQALEMVEVQNNITSSMMDTFASIISNNVNRVMKFLTTMTILLAIPTMVASFWGMNVEVPFQVGENIITFGGSHFWVIITTSFGVATVVGYLLWRKNMF